MYLPALTGIVRDGGQMVAAVQVPAHKHKYSHVGRVTTLRRNKRSDRQEIIDTYREQLAKVGKAYLARMRVAQMLSISDSTIKRALRTTN